MEHHWYSNGYPPMPQTTQDAGSELRLERLATIFEVKIKESGASDSPGWIFGLRSGCTADISAQ